jgi:aminopeptidase-like protein
MRTDLEMYGWASDLFPINRSLTGNGVRETLNYIKELLPQLVIHEVPAGLKVLDWEVPAEWNITDAYIKDSLGKRVVDFKENNLHVVGYSRPIQGNFSRAELDCHLYSLPNQPTAIPYVTSYYQESWGFCISEVQRLELGDGSFDVKIDSRLDKNGSLTYADLVIPGNSKKEVLFSTYICHPSMANNELSGIVVLIALARWISELKDRKFTYRLVFTPETIGAIIYLSKHLEYLKSNVVAGWQVTCVGDDRAYSYLPSRKGNTVADRISKRVLARLGLSYETYSYLERGSDERQWCSPGADLPVCSIMRSKYGTFPEYHTSLDDLSFVTPSGLLGAYNIFQSCVLELETVALYRAKQPGEPQLGPRGLYPSSVTDGTKSDHDQARNILNVLAYCDGENDLEDLAEITGIDACNLENIVKLLYTAGLIKRIEED